MCVHFTTTDIGVTDEHIQSRTDQIWDIQPYSTSGAPKPVTSTTAVRPTTSTVAPPPPAPTTTDEEEDTPAPTVSVDATTLFKTRPVGITPIAPNPKAAIGRVGKIVPTQA